MERTSVAGLAAGDHGAVGSDRLEAAVACFKKRIQGADRTNPEVHNDLGIALTLLGRLDEAVGNLEAAVALRPDFAAAHGALGNALRLQGRLSEAASQYQRMLALRPDDAGARNDFAAVLMALGRVKDAVGQYGLAVVAKPDHAATYFNLGSAFDSIGRAAEAVLAYRRAVAVDAGFAAAHHSLGNVLRRLGRLAEAEAHYRRAVAIAPNHAGWHRSLGDVLAALNRHCEAIAAYRAALAVGAADAGIYDSLGVAHNVLGQVDAAFAAFSQAVAIEPGNAALHLNLATCKPFADGDERLGALEKLSEGAALLSENDQIALHFALGKAFDDLKQPERSFRHLSAGNRLKRSQIAYDVADTVRQFQRIQAAFTPDLVARNAGVGEPSTLPVFVVGMPRSGTTLIEQILASHPRVFGAGERLDLGRVVESLRDEAGSEFPEAVTTMTAQALRRAGARYVERIRSLAPDRERIVDKMPFNSQFVGLIHLILPNARVIHVRRDPLDTCFSCYSQLFVGRQPYAYDLAELGHCYRAYEELMDHWRRVLPHGSVLDVRYEDVVDDLEGEARRIVDHCNLAWDDACLRFYETRRSVVTASFAQVRRPVNRRSIGRWRPYRPMLQPLIEALGRQDPIGSGA